MITGHGRRLRIARRTVAVVGLGVLLGGGAVSAVTVSRASADAARATDKSYDLTGDGVVDSADVAVLQSYYGQAATTPGAQAADFNSDGVVNITDLSILLSHFGPVAGPTTTSAASSTSAPSATTATPTQQSPTTAAPATTSQGAGPSTVDDDINRDGVVDSRDLDVLESYYGKTLDTPEARRADLDGDGTVNVVDLSIFLSHLPAATTLPTSTSTTSADGAVNDDVNRDGVVDDRDLDALKSHFGEAATTPEAQRADLNADGVVDVRDLSVFLSHLPEGAVITTPPGTASGPPTLPPPLPTHSETVSVRSGVHTFAVYNNASGVGPAIAYRQVVQVSCKVKDGTIKSVNPDGYWYRIASPPWNNAYYSPANTFLNGDPPNGPYSRNTDFSVPDCAGVAPLAPSTPGSPPTPTINKALPPATSNKQRHLWIVTLGDSYTAGNGAGANYDGCHRSYNSYAWLYMNRLRDAGRNVDIWQRACSGNVTYDVPGQLDYVAGKTPVGDDADLVLMTIGGNDLDFTSIVLGCLLPLTSYTPGSFGVCSNELDFALNNIDAVVRRTRALLHTVAAREPRAAVVLVGYPVLSNPKCPKTPWNSALTTAQNSYDEAQQTMVSNLDRAEATGRYHFVSVAKLFAGRGPCASSPSQYVRGADAIPYWASYHPNALGNQAIANLLYSAGAQNW